LLPILGRLGADILNAGYRLATTLIYPKFVPNLTANFFK
jgi:hypothetical protein